MDTLEVFVISLFAVLLGACAIIFTYFYMRRYAIIQELMDFSIDNFVNSEENQKLLYQIGGFIGSGMKGGIGIELPVKQRSGKFKWQDIALELATQFIAKGLNNPSPSPLPLPLPVQQDIKTHKINDKW